jgi:DNA gyrase inhibitor GyrI
VERVPPDHAPCDRNRHRDRKRIPQPRDLFPGLPGPVRLTPDRGRFGSPPTASATDTGSLASWGGREDATGWKKLLEGYELSQTRVQEFADLHLAFIRHIGPYETVKEEYWHRLDAWWRRRGLRGRPIFLGIGDDAPGITAPDRLRFDAAVRLPGPIESGPEIGYQLLALGPAAVTRHIGPDRSLPMAYGTIFSGLASLRGYRIVGLPSVEIYHTARIDAGHELNQTDICVPVAFQRSVSRE